MWRASKQLSSRVCGGISRVQNGGPVRLCSQAPKSGQPAAKQPSMSAPPPPAEAPPPSSGSGGGVFWKLTGVTVLAAGGVVGYAWYDKGFRKTVEDNVPYSNKAFDVIFEYLPESKPAVAPKSPKVAEAPKQGLAKTISVPAPKPDAVPAPVALVPPPTPEPRPVVAEPKAAKAQATRAGDERRRMEEEKKRAEEERVRRRMQEKEADEAAENAALETVISAVTGDAVESSLQAINMQLSAANITESHTIQLKHAMDDSTPLVDKQTQWKCVGDIYEAKKEAVEWADKLTQQAQENLEKLKAAIKEGRKEALTKKNAALIGAEETLNQLSYDLKNAIAKHDKMSSQAKVMEEYRDLVRKGKEQFRKELESIMPDVRIPKRVGMRMTEEEMNSLIAHAHRRIEQLQQQLAEHQALETTRMQAALERQKEEDEKLADSRVSHEKDNMRAVFNVEKQKMDTEFGVEMENELRRQLSRQAAAHSDHLSEVLKVQERELHERYEALLRENMIRERENYRVEMAGDIARMRGIEAAVEGRAEMEKIGRKAQELWLACQTLVNMVQTGKEGARLGEDQLQPLKDEVKAVQDAGNNHPFVNTVVESFPAEAISSGVWTQEALVNRFKKVRRVCKRVAMIDETGGTLFQFFLSYLQSFVVFSRTKALTESDLVEPGSLSTFIILDNAAHCMEKGELEQALRYMNQLRGESRLVAQDWIKDVRLLLETRQAADALLAHASASGLGSLF